MTCSTSKGTRTAIATSAWTIAILLGGALLWTPAVLASCGSAVCSVNTDWAAHGAFTEAGLRLDVRAEYIPQDQPREGAKPVKVGEVPADHNEVHTWNRNIVTTLDYGFSEQWGASVSLPYVSRDHKHIHADEAEVEKWQITGLGDTRVMGRYVFAQEPGSTTAFGLHFGAKLPTGATDAKNGAGEEAERTLQLGTGTTDGIVGAFYQRSLVPKLGFSVQAMRQSALNEHDDFRPGDRTTLDIGLRYEASNEIALLVQLNGTWKERDSGDQAEPKESGGRYYYISPGLAYAFNHDVQIYGFYQWAAYQYVNGVQLTADAAAVIGTSVRF